MYDYSETISLPKINTPDNVDVVLDNIPTKADLWDLTLAWKALPHIKIIEINKEY